MFTYLEHEIQVGDRAMWAERDHKGEFLHQTLDHRDDMIVPAYGTVIAQAEGWTARASSLATMAAPSPSAVDGSSKCLIPGTQSFSCIVKDDEVCSQTWPGCLFGVSNWALREVRACFAIDSSGAHRRGCRNRRRWPGARR